MVYTALRYLADQLYDFIKKTLQFQIPTKFIDQL